MKFFEYVVVRDYNRNGLALFSMADSASPGNICCFSVVRDFSSTKPGWRPDMRTVALCYEEASMDYYHRGRLVRPDDPRTQVMLERYLNYVLYGYQMTYGKDVELEIVVVSRDQERFRKERWKR